MFSFSSRDAKSPRKFLETRFMYRLLFINRHQNWWMSVYFFSFSLWGWLHNMNWFETVTLTSTYLDGIDRILNDMDKSNSQWFDWVSFFTLAYSTRQLWWTISHITGPPWRTPSLKFCYILVQTWLNTKLKGKLIK